MYNNKKLQKVKQIVSAFGSFGDIEVKSDVIASLLEEFEKYDFIPNPISVVQIELPSNTPKQIYRPGLIHKDNKCSVAILPERIDIEFDNSILSTDVFDYMEILLKKFEKRANRLAYNILIEWNDNIGIIEEKLFKRFGYGHDRNLVEWTVHSVDRELLKAINEEINIGVDVMKAMVMLSPTSSQEKIIIKYDINTMGQNVVERFDYGSIRTFYDNAETIVENRVSEMERVTI